MDAARATSRIALAAACACPLLGLGAPGAHALRFASRKDCFSGLWTVDPSSYERVEIPGWGEPEAPVFRCYDPFSVSYVSPGLIVFAVIAILATAWLFRKVRVHAALP